MNLCILEQDEKLWLYRVEDAILMVEVKPSKPVPPDSAGTTIGQVVLKRLISAEEAIERLSAAASAL